MMNTTVCIRNWEKLNLAMVVWFQAQVNFKKGPSCPKISLTLKRVKIDTKIIISLV